jgi:hypothetical protein
MRDASQNAAHRPGDEPMETTSPPHAFTGTLACFRADGHVAGGAGGAQGIGWAAAQALHEDGGFLAQ